MALSARRGESFRPGVRLSAAPLDPPYSLSATRYDSIAAWMRENDDGERNLRGRGEERVRGELGFGEAWGSGSTKQAGDRLRVG